MAEDGVEFSGRTVEEAITQAETYFGGSRADLRITVITQGRGRRIRHWRRAGSYQSAAACCASSHACS